MSYVPILTFPTVGGGDAQPGGDTQGLTTTPTRICPADPLRISLVMRNESATETVRVGAQSITATQGLALGPGDGIALNASEGATGEWWAVAASGTPNLSFAEVRIRG